MRICGGKWVWSSLDAYDLSSAGSACSASSLSLIFLSMSTSCFRVSFPKCTVISRTYVCSSSACCSDILRGLPSCVDRICSKGFVLLSTAEFSAACSFFVKPSLFPPLVCFLSAPTALAFFFVLAPEPYSLRVMSDNNDDDDEVAGGRGRTLPPEARPRRRSRDISRAEEEWRMGPGSRGGEGEPRKPLKEGSRKVGVLGLENDLRLLVSGDLRWFSMVCPWARGSSHRRRIGEVGHSPSR